MTDYKAKLGIVARQLYHEYYCKTCLNHGCDACSECNIEVILNDPVVKEAAMEQRKRDSSWFAKMAEHDTKG